MKTCAKCKSTFPNFIIKDGKKVNFQRRKYCLSCSPLGKHNTAQLEIHREKKSSYPYQKARGTKRKIELVNIMGGCCQSCGYNRNLGALEFHHINPKEKITQLDVRNLTNRKWSFIIEEANKCKLLCANCHAEEHYPYLNKWGQ
jgi:hypothetical protein